MEYEVHSKKNKIIIDQYNNMFDLKLPFWDLTPGSKAAKKVECGYWGVLLIIAEEEKYL